MEKRRSSDYECKSSTSEISVKAGPSTANLEVPPKRKRGRKNIFDERLSASLDFAKLSDRKATVVLTSTLKVQPNTPLTVHWDGKLIEDITGHKTVDRLPILVSGQGVDQLLAVPKLSHGTGEACASAVYDTIVSWNLGDKIKCFASTPLRSIQTKPLSDVGHQLAPSQQMGVLVATRRHRIIGGAFGFSPTLAPVSLKVDNVSGFDNLAILDVISRCCCMKQQ
ncbi:hypothetical protein EVAR_89356_1 [Eumeta japonica]|uniref:Uncharacterized protein n=1 Tax=Eumeta variegata TaxID=151549 RepID=A0A4C1Y4V0_EUMVA|nr:hypothetical protein EVAR_89356_1 [Eumeta japonica]